MAAPRVSLATVVAATLAGVTTLLLVPYSVSSYKEDAKQQRASLSGLAHVHADALSAALALPIWNIDRPQIDKVIEAMAKPKSIYGIRVNAAGAVHGVIRGEGWQLTPWKDQSPPSDCLIEERPIVFNGETIGTLRLVVTPKFVQRDLHALRIRMVTTIMGIDLLLILCTYFVLFHVVLKPIFKIERYALAVRDGKGATTIAGRAFVMELESLRSSIETMVNLLDTRYAELEKLRRSEKMAAMGVLVAGVAHEVRNPLFGMSAMLDAYSKELSHLELTDFSAALRSEVGRLKHLMTELLEFGKPIDVASIPEDLRVLIDEVVEHRTRSASEAKVTLMNRVEHDLPLIAMDHQRLRQVFENLIENAIQHSPVGGTVEISTSQVAQEEQTWIECRVEDHGDGFYPNELERVLEPFYTRREGGTGLGLSIVQRIVEEHDGYVSVGNLAHGGAVITVRLPAAR